ncbi:Gfo/Idh/MocA family protein [Bacillus glycinifermentans]|uniref:Gfo/Idh/MocA family protein n=1 Tax=Bacillus glycinifermentans TaxID=1664069 RepID=UPI001FF5310A|nr:Gfo/Idh/MocA family oxidoreductase [Bacillus glycinifermentans]MEC3606131.1 Gfo/Idh/MocA family oxidoreductase [Bacillus glycinifermentans]UOY90490.1 Gfo/Idh/MocA family oxidoreductase [Bacillus glycinifermentans]
MVRFGVIGTNWITDRFLEAAGMADDFQFTSVYSRSEERGQAFAQKYGVTAVFTDAEEMAKSDLIDAVYIASPNSLHKEQAIMFMENGKHVLCEKPLASNVKEAEAMVKTAQIQKVAFMEAMKTTFLPNFTNIIDHLPRIGKIRRFTASYCQYSSRYDAYKSGTVLNAFNPAFSNGSLMDIGVYCVHPAVVLFGKPLEVKANGLILESGADGEGTVLLTYPEHEAVLMHSKISNSFMPAEIQGEDGSIVIDKIHRPEKVEIRYRDGRVEDITVPDEKPAMFYEIEEFISLIKQGRLESRLNTFERSLATLSVMDEARKQIGLVFPADQA